MKRPGRNQVSPMSGKGRGAPPVYRALHIASFFTRQGAPTSGETTAATVVDIDPRPRGPGRPPKQHPQQGETAAHGGGAAVRAT